MTARLLLLGYPKSGKTGSIAPLANSGRTIRYLDFDNNVDPLKTYCTAEGLKRIQRVPCLDVMGFEKSSAANGNEDVAAVLKEFRSWPTMCDALDKWPTDGSDPRTWDNSNVLVFDSLTAMAQTRWRANLKFSKRSDQRMNYKAVQDRLTDFFTLVRDTIRCPVIVLAHIQVIGPDFHVDEDVESVSLKERILEKKLEEANISDIFFGPVSAGQAQAKTLPAIFSGVALVKASDLGREIFTTPRNGFHLAIPAAGVDSKLPIASGLATIFNAWAPMPKPKPKEAAA